VNSTLQAIRDSSSLKQMAELREARRRKAIRDVRMVEEAWAEGEQAILSVNGPGHPGRD